LGYVLSRPPVPFYAPSLAQRYGYQGHSEKLPWVRDTLRWVENGQHQASGSSEVSEATLRTNHRLRWPILSSPARFASKALCPGPVPNLTPALAGA